MFQDQPQRSKHRCNHPDSPENDEAAGDLWKARSWSFLFDACTRHLTYHHGSRGTFYAMYACAKYSSMHYLVCIVISPLSLVSYRTICRVCCLLRNQISFETPAQRPDNHVTPVLWAAKSVTFIVFLLHYSIQNSMQKVSKPPVQKLQTTNRMLDVYSSKAVKRIYCSITATMAHNPYS